MSEYQDLQTQRFKTDLVVPGVGREVQPTASGDWPLVTGRLNLLGAHRRRAVTVPGAMVHRPEYGGGLLLELERLASPANLARSTTTIRNNALRDGRISDASVTGEVLPSGAVKMALEITPRGSETTETTEIVLE